MKLSIPIRLLYVLGLALAYAGFSGCDEDESPYVDLTPVPMSISPSSGQSCGGTHVTIQGEKFQRDVKVLIGGACAGSVVVHSDQTITCVTPPGSEGQVNVEVVNSSFQKGVLRCGFTFMDPPIMTSIAPDFAPSNGGGNLMLRGKHFRQGAQVTAGGMPCTFIDYTQVPTIVHCITPALFPGSSVDVKITNPDGQSHTLLKALRIVAMSGVTGVSPPSGSMAGGTAITVFGTDIQNNATIELGGNPCTNFDYSGTPNRVVCTTPPGALPGPVELRVTNHVPGDISTTLANAFMYMSPMPPDAGAISPAWGALAGGNQVVLSGTGFFPGAAYVVRFGQAEASAVTVNSSTQITCTTPASAVPCAVQVVVTGPDGQSDPTPVSYTYSAAAYPDATGISPSSGPLAGGNTVTLTGTGFFPGTSVQVHFSGAAATGVNVVSTTQITCVVPATALPCVASVTITNPDGQSDPTPVQYTYLGASPPDATQISPGMGSAAGGTFVVLTGTGFYPGSVPAVTFNGLTATSVNVPLSTALICQTPASPAIGPVAVVVTNPDGQADSTPVQYVFQAANPPGIASILPGMGAPTGGTPVTISGSGFIAGASVAFNGAAATGISVASSTSITCTTPANPAGSAVVTVTNVDLQSCMLYNGFLYTNQLAIGGVVPNSGPAAGGTNVSISGAMFQNGATVLFGTAPATNVVFVSSSNLTCTTPAHAGGIVNVQVTNPDLTSCSLVNGFTFIDPPVIQSIVPSTGATSGGTRVTVSGTCFSNGTLVSIGGLACSNYDYSQVPVKIVCNTPTGSAGTVNVVVTNPDSQTSTLVNGFRYLVWHDLNWSYRRPITVTGTTGGQLKDHQVKVVVPYDSDMQTDFRDIRFTHFDGSSESYADFWLETYTSGTQATFWVEVPAIPSSGITTTLYVYYGNLSASSASVYDSTFTKTFGETGIVGLWHLDDGSGSAAADSSVFGNNGVLNNFLSPQGWAGADGGQWGSRSGVQFSTGDSLLFDGTDDYLSCGTDSSLSLTSALTIEAWVKGNKKTVNGKEQVIVSKWQVQGSGFTNTANWAAYDPGANGVGTSPDGYRGAVFDGRYIYFSPENRNTGHHGEAMRFDTHAPFASASSWATFDAGANGVGSDPDGYSGAVFDGRYVYFVPYYNGSNRHGEVLRHDTQGAFTTVSSWTTYNPHANGVGSEGVGFYGGVFDGRYVYMVPYHNGYSTHGEVMRYDTQAPFKSTSSWVAYDAGSNGVGTDPDGYIGAVFDGRYIYFSPHHCAPNYSGEVLRYDTLASFTSTSSWSAYDPGANGVGTSPDGFCGAVYDGRYVYFVPNYRGTAPHGEVMRYDTQGTFASTSSWITYDPGSNGVGTDPDGFDGAIFDGRFVYFVPNYDGTANYGELLRFDTQGSFTSTSSWSTFDPGSNGIGVDPDGLYGAVMDGRYIYFPSYHNGTSYSGEVLRYDTCGNSGSYGLTYSCLGQEGGFSGAAFGISGIINTGQGAFSVHSNTDLAAGSWHHVAVTYDGATLSLYVDAALARSCSATGSIYASSVPVLIGSLSQSANFFDGSIDEVRIYSRALSLQEITCHFERRKFASSEPSVSSPGAEESK